MQDVRMHSTTLRGSILLAVGTVLLLHTLGIFQQGLSLLIIIVSLLIIAYGAILLDLPHKISKLLNKTRK